MPKGGKYTYPDACGAPGKPKFQGGRSYGKKARISVPDRATPMTKSVGTPKDKGVNR